MALLAGGAMRAGQVIAARNHLGREADSRPATIGEVLATLNHNHGVKVASPAFTHAKERPHDLVENRTTPLRELV